jgi:sugar transferase (PEP-CTERM/EpsH1 system associated)
MARILFLSHRVPFPPNKGDKIRSFNEIRHLSSRHELHLLAFYDHPEESEYSKDLQEYCRTVTLVPLLRSGRFLRAGLAMLRGRPWSVGYFSDPAMKQAFTEKLAALRFDLIFVFCSSMAPYALQTPGIPRILDFVDSDALKWRQYSEVRRAPIRWLFGYEARKLSELERRMIDEFDCSIFVSKREVSDQTDPVLFQKTIFIQNGIDLEFFKPSGHTGGAPAVAFTGAMDYFPNADGALYFARDIFPRIRSIYPEARFYIVGSNPSTKVRKLADLPGVIVTGSVEDVRPFLAQCQVAVVPLRIAQGIQNKILEALAMGIPVVATPRAAEGLAGIKDLPLKVAANADLFAKQVVDMIMQAPLKSDVVERCRLHLANYFNWATNLTALDRTIENLASKQH